MMAGNGCLVNFYSFILIPLRFTWSRSRKVVPVYCQFHICFILLFLPNTLLHLKKKVDAKQRINLLWP